MASFWLYPIAFISGILVVLSPCVLPILPIVLGVGADGSKKRIYGTILGLIVSFTFFSLALSSIVVASGISADTIRTGAAILLGLFGLALAVPQLWTPLQAKLEQWFHPPVAQQQEPQSFWGGFLTGGVLGVVWTPCVGPIIAAVSTLAALQSFSLGMFLLMLSFAIGVSLPLLGIALGSQAVLKRLHWYKKHQGQVRRVFGVILIATAFLLLSGLERRFQTWILDNLPTYIVNPVEQFENRFELPLENLEN